MSTQLLCNQTITALEVAHNAGMHVSRRGNHWWMLCPLHQEKSASFCFYNDGGWYCFGCKRGGCNGISLYAALNKLTYQEAARAIVSGQGAITYKRQPTYIARSILHQWQHDRLRILKRVYERANIVLSTYQDEDAWSDPEFIQALLARSTVSNQIAELKRADILQLINLYKEANDGFKSSKS